MITNPRMNPRTKTASAPEASLIQANFAPRARPLGSVLFLAAAWATALTMHGDTASHLAHYAAIGVGIGLAASIIVDFRDGILNLIRADLFAILALYFLTFFEFLFKQDFFDTLANPDTTRQAILSCIIGFSGMVIGRHFLTMRKHPLSQLFFSPVPGGLLIAVFWLFIFIGSLHMLVATNFNPALVFHHLVGPRFSQPWARERFGDWRALLVELSMLFYLIPPIAGVVLARRKKYNWAQILLVIIGFVMVLFYGFVGGTRNLFISYLVTFLIGYAFALARGRTKELVAVGAVCAVMTVSATVLMLQFREVGLESYVNGGYQVYLDYADQESFFVDYNLYAIGQLIKYFPSSHPYLGWEVPYLALIRPIPRALWPGKPEGMSMTIEDAMDVDGMTIAASFIGEAHMSGGPVAVFLVGLFFGALTGWWGLLASPRNSELGILVYSSGFFAAVISMRSLFVFTTALLPTIASIVAGTFFVKKIVPMFRNKLGGPRKLPRPARQPNPPPRPRR